jgi:hypothetical protein
MKKLVLSLLAVSALSISANAWAIPDDVGLPVNLPDGPLTVATPPGGAAGFGPFGTMIFELDSVTWSPASLGCAYYYEWIAPAGIAVADGFVVELATHGGANCFANSAAPPAIPVVTTVTLDTTTAASYPPSGFNRFLQFVPVCQMVLGETVLPGGATMQGIVGFGPTIAPVATEFDSFELVAG